MNLLGNTHTYVEEENVSTISCDSEIKNQDPREQRIEALRALTNFESHSYINMRSKNLPEFAEKVDIGDEVMVIGEFHYSPKGDIITFGDGSKGKRKTNYGEIAPHVILKVE